MQPKLNILKHRYSNLSNHHQKFIRIIEQHGESLIDRLEARGKIDDVHLWKIASNFSAEMDCVTDVAEDVKEKLRFLGCYHAFQILHLNIRSLDLLMSNLTQSNDKSSVYKNFMLDVGKQFQQLTATYMAKVMDLFFEDHTYPDYTITSVGSLAHQDDIDVGIIDDGTGDREEFNKVIGKLRQEMFKWATEMHVYMSEHVGIQNYSASIEEYQALLDKEIGDIVIISEMLMSKPILGNDALYHRFERKVTRKYYFSQHRDNSFHEGYLRGILGEVQSLLIRPINQGILNPKDDALRMLLGIVMAGRTIFRIYHGNRWEVLSELRNRDPRRRTLYEDVEEAISFIEVFRHIYQLYVAQEEKINLEDQSIVNQLELVARVLGYQKFGAIRAWDHLMIHYHEKVKIAKEAISRLLDNAVDHLKEVSIFTPMIATSRESGIDRPRRENFVISFLRKSVFFKGTRFWNDVLASLDSPEGHVLDAIVQDFRRIKPRFLERIIDKYTEISIGGFYPVIYFLVRLAQNQKRLQCEDLFNLLNKKFLNYTVNLIDRTTHILNVFSQFPALLHHYLKILKDEERELFKKLLTEEPWEPENQAIKARLQNLVDLHFNLSHYFSRFFIKIIDQYPDYIQFLQNTTVLEQIARGFLGKIDGLLTFEEKKKQLGAYYDLQFFRLGLETLQGRDIEYVNSEYTVFSDSYIQTLFDICKQKVVEEIGESLHTRDLFAIYAAGGHAREHAFDDDYDLIIFLNDTSAELKDFVTKIVIKMNSDLVKRGLMPQYRLSDHFKEFVTLVDDFDDYLRMDRYDVFIDLSQILGARMVVGSTKFDQQFVNSIIRPHIFEKKDTYITMMLSELESRHKGAYTNLIDSRNIKESLGGLRDLEAILLIYKAKYELLSPVNLKLISQLCQIRNDLTYYFNELMRAFNFLKNLRNIYRLTIAADDLIEEGYLDRVARVMRLEGNANVTPAQRLERKYLECKRNVINLSTILIDAIKNKSAGEVRL